MKSFFALAALLPLISANENAKCKGFRFTDAEIANFKKDAGSQSNYQFNECGVFSRCLTNGHALLTIDDGPHANNTIKVLKLLEERGVKAVFNVIGQNVKQNPKLLELIHKGKHDIGSHSFSHPHLVKLSIAEVRRELKQAQAAIGNITKKSVVVMRPPYGEVNENVISVASGEMGHRIMIYNVDSRDWDPAVRKGGAKAIAAKTLAELDKLKGKGAIILLDEIIDETIDALCEIIDGVRKRNYEFVDLATCVCMNPAEVKAKAQEDYQMPDEDDPDCKVPIKGLAKDYKVPEKNATKEEKKETKNDAAANGNTKKPDSDDDYEEASKKIGGLSSDSSPQLVSSIVLWLAVYVAWRKFF